MNQIRQFRKICNITVLLVLFQLLVGQAMAASADFHEACHDHSHDPSHECIVTMILSGGYNVEVPDILPVEFIPEKPPEYVVFPRPVVRNASHLVGGVLAQSPPRGP